MKKKLILMTFVIAIICLMIPITSRAASDDLYLNNYDFDIEINSDGSMDVTEIWDISIEDTNTLFKTFKTDNTKYSGIKDVYVTEITNGNEKVFTEIDEYMYHVTKDCYYGLKNDDGDFEIAWGVSLENKRATRKYKIEYTVTDAIAKYNDYAELYWQFVGKDFEIAANKVKGTITLPSSAKSKEDIRVWGHTRDLNGTIYATDVNKIEFDLNKYRGNRYIEIRSLFPKDMITYSKRTYSSDILDKALKEETKWAEDANRQRKIDQAMPFVVFGVYAAIMMIFFIIFIKKTKKYKKLNKELKKYEPTNKIEYYREMPDENATPGEAVFILKNLHQEGIFNMEFGKVFSATMLNLSLKKYIDLTVDKTKKGKNAIIIKIINKGNKPLKSDEEEIFKLLEKIAKNKEEITIKDLEKYIKNHTSAIEKLIKNVFENVKDNTTEEGYFDKNEHKKYQEYAGYAVGYISFAIFCIAFLPTAIVLLINGIYCSKIAGKINYYTQAGVDQKEMWKGLKKYMQDFSLLKEREVPEIVIWEKYLVYATAFGIADKVLKQLKLVYPNIDQLDGMETSAYMYFMYHSNFNTNFSNAINSSISSAMSSGSGSGGGFSGGGGFGGGGRRWWR